MNITLTQTIPVEETWIFEIEDGDSCAVTSSSEYLLYLVTRNNLIIIKRREAPAEAAITLIKDNETTTYTLEEYVPEENTNSGNPTPITPTVKTTIYYGSSSTVPNTLTPEGYQTVQVSGNSGSVTFTNTNKTKWIAIPSNWTLTEWKETSDNTSLMSNLSTKTIDNYTMYYEYNNFIDTNTMRATFNK